MNEINSKIKSTGIRKIILWLFAIFFLLFALFSLTENLGSFLIFFFTGLFLLPPMRAYLERRLKRNFPKYINLIIGILGIVVGSILLPTKTVEQPTNVSNTTGANEQKINAVETQKQNSLPNQGEYLVQDVVDGDTIRVDMSGTSQTIRLIGIDAPELGSCFGEESKNKMDEILLNGKTVTLAKDDNVGDKDKYERLLRYIVLENQVNLNLQMVEEGYAREYTYDKTYQYQAEFRTAENNARNNKIGMWAEGICTGQETPQNSETNSNNMTSTNSQTSNSNEISESSSNETSQNVVKKSSSGICHAPETTYYEKTKNYTAFNSVDECLKSGGRLPR